MVSGTPKYEQGQIVHFYRDSKGVVMFWFEMIGTIYYEIRITSGSVGQGKMVTIAEHNITGADERIPEYEDVFWK